MNNNNNPNKKKFKLADKIIRITAILLLIPILFMLILGAVLISAGGGNPPSMSESMLKYMVFFVPIALLIIASFCPTKSLASVITKFISFFKSSKTKESSKTVNIICTILIRIPAYCLVLLVLYFVIFDLILDWT